MTYWIEYRMFNKGQVTERVNTHTDSLKIVRGQMADTIGMNTLLSGGIFVSKTANYPMAYVIFDKTYKAHVYVDFRTKDRFLLDSRGNLTKLE